MKWEWSGLNNLAVTFILGVILVVLMFLTQSMTPKEYLRDAKLIDGSEADWYDKAAAVLYSPGELHAAHFKSEINCQHCHIPGKRVSSDYCISCHSKEDFRKNTKEDVLRDSHIAMIQGMSCFDCHTEHQGLGGRISVVLDLEGHKNKIKPELQADCKQCHLSEFKNAHLNMINQKCVDCHTLEQPFLFKNHTFRHTDLTKLQIDSYSNGFIKLSNPEEGVCKDCHQPDFHVADRTENGQIPSIEGEFDCGSCHNLNRIKE